MLPKTISEDECVHLLEMFSLSEILSMCYMDEWEALKILVDTGNLELPPVLETLDINDIPSSYEGYDPFETTEE